VGLETSHLARLAQSIAWPCRHRKLETTFSGSDLTAGFADQVGANSNNRARACSVSETIEPN
jgi:hypothetical protein